MAFSKSQIPDTAQHYLVCGTEDCKKNCQFYCNPCHLQLCEKCRDEHHRSSDTQNHEVVPYRQRQHHLPVEKCKDHLTKDIDMICEDCKIPVCSKCVTQDHQKHTLGDLETIYSKGFTLCLDEIYKIHQYFLPTSQDIQKDIMKDAKQIKATMDKIRTSMMAEAESLKCLVDTVLSDKIEQVNKMEASLMEELQSQDKIYQDYTSYLNDLVKEFQGYLSSTKLQNNPIIFSFSDQLKIQPIPEITKPVPPVLTAGQYCKEDVTKLLGEVTVPDTKPENKKIKPGMENSSIQTKLTEEQRKQDREKSHVKQTLSLSSSVTNVIDYTVPGVKRVFHISLGKSGRLWVSDNIGNLVQTDLQGNQLEKIQTSGKYGYHTVTQDGDLIYTDKKNKVIYCMKQDKTITKFIRTRNWAPISIHSSNINAEILVGMIKNKQAKVTRYNKTGKEIQKIKRDNKGHELYGNPFYITENINGDICTSDYDKKALVVVNKSGQHRFSYTGLLSEFYPWGMCTDLLGHILVCDGVTLFSKIHILDQDGQFLSELLIQEICPSCLCVNNENNLILGRWNSKTLTVFRYLE